jgi:predicted small lipoprotein YifL
MGMRGRILLAILTTTLGLAACGKRDSLFIEPGKADPPAKHAVAKPPPRSAPPKS